MKTGPVERKVNNGVDNSYRRYCGGFQTKCHWKVIGVSFIYELLESLERYGSLRFIWAAGGERLRFSVAEYELAFGGFIGTTDDLEVNNRRLVEGYNLLYRYYLLSSFLNFSINSTGAGSTPLSTAT